MIMASISHQAIVMFKNYLLPGMIKDCFPCFFVQILPKTVSIKNYLGNIKISDSKALPSEVDSVVLGVGCGDPKLSF